MNEYGLGVLAGDISVIIRDFFDASGHKGEVSLLGVMQRNDTLKNLVWLKESGKGSDECLGVMRLEVRKATEAFIREDAAVKFVNMVGRVVGLGVSVEAGPTVTREIDWRTQAKPATTKPSVMSDGDFLKLCEFSNAGKVEAAIVNGADVNARNNDGMTALMLATRKDYTEVAELLLRHGADVNAKSKQGNTPLHFAHNAKAAEVLLRYGADVNAKNNDGETVFTSAASSGNLDVVEVLFRHGANFDAKSAMLHTRNVGVMEFLIRHGADINAKYHDGKTLLHLVAEEGNVEAAQFLMRHGANKGLKDDKGKQPFYYTRYEDDEGYWAHNDVYGVLMLHNY